MTRRDDPYAEERADISFFGRQGVKWTLIVVALVLLIGAAVWGIRVLTAPVTGAGDAFRQQQSAQNQIEAQRYFNQAFESIKALDKNIGVAAVALKRTPTDERRQIEYDGLVRNCNDAVAAYNSRVREYLSKGFKDSDLPDEIGTTDRATDCKE